MKRQNIYETLQQYKSAGMSCLKASQILKIDYKTAHKYWKMSPEEYQNKLLNYQNRDKKADPYRDEALALLRRAPFLSAAQIAKCICQNKGIQQLEVSDKAFWNYIAALRKEYNIPKNALSVMTLLRLKKLLYTQECFKSEQKYQIQSVLKAQKRSLNQNMSKIWDYRHYIPSGASGQPQSIIIWPWAASNLSRAIRDLLLPIM